MKIVGNHPGDYYDIGLSAGVDEQILYVRNKPEPVHSPENMSPLTNFWPYYKTVAASLDGKFYLEVQPITIGFAGKVYVLLCYAEYKPYGLRLNESPGSFKRLAYKEDLLKPYNGDLHYKHYQPNIKKIKLFKSYEELKEFTDIDFRTSLPWTLKNHDFLRPDPMLDFAPFYQIGAPIFISGLVPGENCSRWHNYKQGFWANPILKDFGFQSIVEPWTAFQELSMFMASWARPQDVTQITDDIVLRDAKGFNEMSFKTVSPGKKRKRKK